MRDARLVLNTAVAEVVERRKHTGVFGRLQGAVMIGTAIGYLRKLCISRASRAVANSSQWEESSGMSSAS